MKTRTMTAYMIALGAVMLTAGAAHATIVEGTASFTDTGPAGNNGLIFSGSTSSSALASGINLSLNTPDTITDFLTITSNDTNNAFLGNATATDTVSEAFTFTLPTDDSGTVDGSGTETTAAFFGVITGVSGSITWDNPATVDFSDGAVLDISLSTASFNPSGGANQKVDVNATFDLIEAPTSGGTPVPEPGTLAVLGSGLAGLGFITRRRKSGGSLAA